MNTQVPIRSTFADATDLRGYVTKVLECCLRTEPTTKDEWFGRVDLGQLSDATLGTVLEMCNKNKELWNQDKTRFLLLATSLAIFIKKFELQLYLVDYANITFILACLRKENRKGRKPRRGCPQGYLNREEVLLRIRNLVSFYLVGKYFNIQADDRFVSVRIKLSDVAFFDMCNAATFEEAVRKIKAPQRKVVMEVNETVKSIGMKRIRPTVQEKGRPFKIRRTEQVEMAINTVPWQNLTLELPAIQQVPESWVESCYDYNASGLISNMSDQVLPLEEFFEGVAPKLDSAAAEQLFANFDYTWYQELTLLSLEATQHG